MRKKKGGKLPPFVPLFWEMLNSPAYMELPHSAAKALPYFMGKVKMPFDDPERYKTEFSFSYKEGQRYGFSNGTFSRVITSLVAHGLIDPIDKGGLKSNCKSTNKFSLSLRWKDYGKPDFEVLNWKCFEPRVSKLTSKMETNNFKNGRGRGQKVSTISKIEVVEAVSA